MANTIFIAYALFKDDFKIKIVMIYASMNFEIITT